MLCIYIFHFRDKKTPKIQSAIDDGEPSITISAVHSPVISAAASANDDDLGLDKDLHLCISARVMVTWNINISLGLVNGTCGIVHDVIMNSNGVVAAILV